MTVGPEIVEIPNGALTAPFFVTVSGTNNLLSCQEFLLSLVEEEGSFADVTGSETTEEDVQNENQNSFFAPI